MSPEENLKKEIEYKDGVLRLKPNFVPRTFYPGLNRLGLADPSAGKRGEYVERWIASCVEADNSIRVAKEGLSVLNLESSKSRVLLKEALNLLPGTMLGEKYAKMHSNKIGVLTKILDIGHPVPWHIHARKYHARKYWKSNPKDEAYFFLDHHNLGPTPFSHLAMHPGTTHAELLELLKLWQDDRVLNLSPAYRLNVGEGFHIPAGVPHAPGTALTLEIQEESDVYNMLQAKHRRKILSKKNLLLRRRLPNEEAVVKLIDWQTSTDPYFYHKYHTKPEPIRSGDNCDESWVFLPRITKKFSGKELNVKPGAKVKSKEKGSHAVLIWRGKGKLNGSAAAARHGYDEFFITYGAATAGYTVENMGSKSFVLYKIFGPDIN